MSNITKDNILVFYRSGDSDSLSVAQRYRNVHNLDNAQLVAIPCSDDEILPNYTTFYNEIELPVLNAITASADIYMLIFVYNVPVGFRHGDDVISTTSRMSRVGHVFDNHLRNPLYDRKSSMLYDVDDVDILRVAATIDGPTVDDALNIINNSETLRNQARVNGRFYFDPYTDIAGSSAAEYLQELLDFSSRVLPQLNIMTCSTIFVDPYIDVVLPYLIHDSFCWSWFTDRATTSFFKTTDAARIFFYNADYDGAKTIRDTSDGNWVPLALTSGYVSASGAMSNPGIDSFLKPSPFFNALLQGATIGEAFLFSTPYLDWTIGFFGDPFLTVIFQAQEDFIATQAEPDEDEIWRTASIHIAKAIAYYYKKETELIQIRDYIVYSTSIPLEVDLLYRAQDLVVNNGVQKRQLIFGDVISYLIQYVYDKLNPIISPQNPQDITLNDYLQYTNTKLSRIITDTSVTDLGVTDNNLYDEGYWELETSIVNLVSSTYSIYNFELQVSDHDDFSNIIFTADSQQEQTNWYYEKYPNEFEQIPINGVPYNFVGRRIRYTSPSYQYLLRGEIYYFRIRQKTSTFYSPYVEIEQIIYT